MAPCPVHPLHPCPSRLPLSNQQYQWHLLLYSVQIIFRGPCVRILRGDLLGVGQAGQLSPAGPGRWGRPQDWSRSWMQGQMLDTAGNGYWLWEFCHVPSHVLLLHVIRGDLHQIQGGGAVPTHQGEEAEHAWLEAGHWLWELYFRGETEVFFFWQVWLAIFFSGVSWCRPSSSFPGLSNLWCRPPPPWKQGLGTCCLWSRSQFEENMFV